MSFSVLLLLCFFPPNLYFLQGMTIVYERKVKVILKREGRDRHRGRNSGVEGRRHSSLRHVITQIFNQAMYFPVLTACSLHSGYPFAYYLQVFKTSNF